MLLTILAEETGPGLSIKLFKPEKTAQALRRLRLSWGLRAIFIASVAGLLSVAAAICLALLTDFGGRSPAAAQAPAAVTTHKLFRSSCAGTNARS
jgi:hypothetical protein